MKSHLLYTLITICIFAGIGAILNGLGKRRDEAGRSARTVALVLGVLLVGAGVLILSFFSEELAGW